MSIFVQWCLSVPTFAVDQRAATHGPGGAGAARRVRPLEYRQRGGAEGNGNQQPAYPAVMASSAARGAWLADSLARVSPLVAGLVTGAPSH